MKIDPRVTILFVLLLSSFAVAFRDAWHMLPLLASALIAVLLARAPLLKLLRRLRGVWIMLVFVTLLQTLAAQDWLAGLLIAATVLQRLVILLLGGALLAGYAGHVLVQAMLQLRMPYQLAFMLSIGLRFVPLFGESYRDSLNAMQLRGVDLRKIKFRARLRIYTWLIMPTIASGIHQARKLAMAMELRGFGARDRRTAYAPLRMRWVDWLGLAGVAIWAAGIILWRVFL
ncbi:MAG: energy-coupling factor transporter transmembrane protein EcfT [Oscillospiraceae bacterium]|nr:energy-coupling factor transporter transmembrane protein EcfT [Oscillospiraceae bacterium]